MGGPFDFFWAYGLTIHTLFALRFSTLDISPNTRPEFHAAFCTLLPLLLPLRNLSLFETACSYSFSTLSIKYPYRSQASAAAAICLKQYHIPLNQFLFFVSLYKKGGTDGV